MSRADFALLVGAVATIATFVHVVPQILRLLRTGRIEGVSPSWAAVGMTLNFGWIAYVVSQEYWIAIPSIVVAIASFGVALYLMKRNGAGGASQHPVQRGGRGGVRGYPVGRRMDRARHGAGAVERVVHRTVGGCGMALTHSGGCVPAHVGAGRGGGAAVGLLRRARAGRADHRVRRDRSTVVGSDPAEAVGCPPSRPGSTRDGTLTASPGAARADVGWGHYRWDPFGGRCLKSDGTRG